MYYKHDAEKEHLTAFFFFVDKNESRKSLNNLNKLKVDCLP